MSARGVHTVGEGDCLYSLAKLYGLPTWKAFYDEPDNADLKKARPEPNVLCRGDEVVIPDVEPSKKNVSCGTNRRHKFQVALPRVLLRVKVKDEDDKPIAGKKFRVEAGGDRFDGTTDGDGIVEQLVPADQKTVRLWVFFSKDEDSGEHLMWDVSMGSLDPSDSPQGIQERLNNLGFLCGDPDGRPHEGMDVATRTFQRGAGIEASGTVDDATAAKLKDAHGKV
jgi:N-acetylmuramoyl-L-alanine amidase